MTGQYSMAIAASPLRISFVGGGSDLPGGHGRTISTSINKYVYAFAKLRHDDRVIVHWREKENVTDSRNLKHELIREILVREGITQGIEIATFADVPGVGSGLGSSAATTASCLAAVLFLKGYNVDENFLSSQFFAESVCDIELNRLRRKGGKQDQYASVIGGLLDIRYDDGDVESFVGLPQDDNRLKYLSQHFALFSAKDSLGRNADDILCTKKELPEWREFSESLCEQFVNAWEKMSVGSFHSLVQQHHDLKATVFGGFKSEKLQNLDLFESFKLCGAGQTGHLLVGVYPETRCLTKERCEEVWGPELPWEPTSDGTKVVFMK